MAHHIHYHSDCDFFAGCESMIANFLNDEELSTRYAISFSCRWSERYENGLRSRVHSKVLCERYPIIAGNFLTQWGAGKGKAAHIVTRMINYILMFRYWVLVWNTVILYRAWRGRGIEILHINNGGYPAALSCLSAALAGRLAGVPQIVMVVNNMAKGGRYWYWWFDRLLDFLVTRSVSLFITGSSSAGTALKTVLKLPSTKQATLHNGIAKRKSTEAIAQTRARLGVPSDALVFGMVALLEWRKGHRVLLKAIRTLSETIPLEEMPQFLLEGDGPDKAELTALVDALGIGAWVRFVGTERQVFNFMQAVDVMVLPSVANEDFPNVVLEAMSLGKPVVASRIAGTPEQIEDGKTGWLVEPGDASALAEKLATFIKNRSTVDAMGTEARRQFEKKFTSKVAVSRYMDLYQKLLNGRAK